MKNVNKLIPSIGTELKEVFEYVTSKGTPLCLYTYETANACYDRNSPLYVRDDENSKENYSLMDDVVSATYGRNMMDNKITIKYSVVYDVTEDMVELTIPIYITFWDSRISISTEVYFFKDINGFDSYRVVPYVSKGPKVVGKIEIPDGYNSPKDSCDRCGCETDSRYKIDIRNEDGAWSDERVCESCYDADMGDDSFKGYWYTDKNGNSAHSWDYEESIGE